MKRFYALLIVALFATAPALMAQSASFYNATRDAEKMIKKMPTENYRRAYVGFNDAHINWKEFGIYGELKYPIKSGVTLGYLQSYHIVKGLPIFVEYGANIHYLFGKEKTPKGEFSTIQLEGYYKANMFALNVPVNASLRLSFDNNRIAVTPYIGLNLRFNLFGNQTSGYKIENASLDGNEGELSDEPTKVRLFDSSKDEEGAAGDLAFNRFQMGLNYGVAFSYDVYTISIGRVSDFTRIANLDKSTYKDKGRMGVTTISVGYAI
jgi:hypothetical protein